MLDLPYAEDVRAQTDMNVVVTGSGDFVEVQGTAEGVPFDRELLDAMLDAAAEGCAELTARQAAAFGADDMGGSDAREAGSDVDQGPPTW